MPYKRLTFLVAVAVASLVATSTAQARISVNAVSARRLVVAPRPMLVVRPARPHVVVRHERARHHAGNPRPVHRPASSVSLYERTTRPPVLRRQGCHVGARNLSGVVILDFGKLSHNGHSYGTMLFSGRFAGNRSITRAMFAFASGYHSCLPRGSHAKISLARGTSNYAPSVPSTYAAGRKWAREVSTLAHWLYYRNLDQHVSSAAADDAEPAWDPHFRKTRDFFRGYGHTGIGRPLYNYGSLDGGIGAYWTARQAFYVAGGMKYSLAIPEIYNRRMALQWAELARVVHRRFHRHVRFAGVMIQGTRHCRCSLRAAVAHRVLSTYLRQRVGRNAPKLPHVVTNILGDY